MANLTYKPGDWECRVCGRHNFASRHWCRWIECGANRHASPQEEMARVARRENEKRSREDPPPLECPDPMYESLAKRVKLLEDAVLKLVRLNRKRDEEDEHRSYQLQQLEAQLDETKERCKRVHSDLQVANLDIRNLYDRVSDLEDSSSDE